MPFFEGNSMKIDGVTLNKNGKYFTSFRNFKKDDFIISNSIGAIGYQFKYTSNRKIKSKEKPHMEFDSVLIKSVVALENIDYI